MNFWGIILGFFAFTGFADVFFRTEKFEACLNDFGSFGCSSGIPDDYNIAKYASGTPYPFTGLGISFDPNGYTWNATIQNPSFCGDFVMSDIISDSNEGFMVDYEKLGSLQTFRNRPELEQTDTAGLASKLSVSNDLMQAVHWVGTSGDLKIDQVIVAIEEDDFLEGRITLKNVGTETLSNIRYVRSIVPHGESTWTGVGEMDTFVQCHPNDRVCSTADLSVVRSLCQTLYQCPFGVGILAPMSVVNQLSPTMSDIDSIWDDTTWQSSSEYDPSFTIDSLNVGMSFDELKPKSSVSFSFVYAFSNDAEELVTASQEMVIIHPSDFFGEGSTAEIVVQIAPSVGWMMYDLSKLVFEIGLPGEPYIRSEDCRTKCSRKDGDSGYRFYTKTISTSGMSSNTDYYIRVKFHGSFTITAATVARYVSKSTELEFTSPLYSDHGNDKYPDYPLVDPRPISIKVNSGSTPASVEFYREYFVDGTVKSGFIGSTSEPTDESCTSNCEYSVQYAIDDMVKTQLMVLKTILLDSFGNPISHSAILVEIIAQNKAPTDIELSTYSVRENIYDTKFSVAGITTTDPNGSDKHSYEILDSIGNYYFYIPDYSDRLNMKHYIDYESRQNMTITIRATDDYGLSIEKDMFISVTNINDHPLWTKLNGTSVFENSPIGTEVGEFETFDEDGYDTFSYSVSSGDNYFKAQDNKLVVSKSINYEYVQTIKISVKTMDNHGGYRYDSFNIEVLNVNENPTFLDLYDSEKKVYLFNPAVNENSPIGTFIYTLTCYGPDANDKQQYLDITMPVDGDGMFIVERDEDKPNVHNFLVNHPGLNYEEKYLYPVEFRCCDDGNLCTSKKFVIRILDVPEPPTASDVSFSIEENSRAETFIGIVPALAEGPKILMTFRIVGGNHDEAFDINACGGALYVNKDILDYEGLYNMYNLLIEISTSKSIIVTATIIILNINEPPFIDDQTISIEENVPVGTLIVPAMIVHDGDGDRDVHSFELKDGNLLDTFALDVGTGEIVVAHDSINYESGIVEYKLKVVVTDALGLEGECYITVKVENINEAPVLPEGELVIQKAELDSGTMLPFEDGTNIGTPFVAYDEDVGQTVSYSLSNCDPFDVNSETGQIFIAHGTMIDYEDQQEYGCKLTAIDDDIEEPLSATKTVTVQILNIQEKPEFSTTGGVITTSIDENSAAESLVFDLFTVASDPDHMGSGKPVLEFSVLSYAIGDDVGDAEDVFQINTFSGEIRLIVPVLDFEAVPKYAIQIRVTDSTGLYDDADLVININDLNEPPVVEFDDATMKGIPENAEIASIAEDIDATGKLSGVTTSICASDPEGLDLIWTIVDGNSCDFFSLITDSSDINCRKIKLEKALDYESQNNYVLSLQISDSVHISNGVVTIIVFNINEAPTIIAPTPGLVVYELAIANDNIGSPLVVEDEDIDDIHVWNFIDNSDDPDNLIGILPSGQLYVTGNGVFDRLVKSTYTLHVKVIDEGGLFDESEISVQVINENEPPVVTPGSFKIPEDLSVNSNFGRVIAVDPDEHVLTYSILSGNKDGHFRVDSSTGSLFISKGLDFETKTSHRFLIQAQDDGTGLMTGTAWFDVTVEDVNETPDIDGDSFTVEENCAIDTSVGCLVASDVDANDVVTTSIQSGDSEGVFTINPSSGCITVSKAELDYESKSVYNLKIRATDKLGLFKEVVATIRLLNKNDAPIMNVQHFTVEENIAAGSKLPIQISCIDQDTADTHTYKMTQDNCWSKDYCADDSTITDFHYFPSELPEFDGRWEVVADIRGSKMATIGLSSEENSDRPEVQVTIGVGAEGSLIQLQPCPTCPIIEYDNITPVLNTDINNSFWIQIVKQSVESIIYVGKGSQITVETVITKSISNVDFNYVAVRGATNIPVNFRSVCLNPNSGIATSVFVVNRSGSLEVMDGDESPLNYEETRLYSFKVNAMDSSAESASDSAVVEIEVLNVNEPPMFIDSCEGISGVNFCFDVPELSPVGHKIGTILAEDEDTGAWGKLTYKITSGNIGDTFLLDSSSGELTVAKDVLNFESALTQYDLMISAIDEGGEEAIASIRISITDVNEPPVLPDSLLLRTFEIDENTKAETTVNVITATDVDTTDDWGDLVFAISKNDGNDFKVLLDGTLVVIGSIDYETKKVYTITVRVIDGGGEYSEADYIINVLDVNESPNVEDTVVEIEENSPKNAIAGLAIKANDPDEGQALLFKFEPTQPSNIFKINSCSGQISVNKAVIDYETKKEYTYNLRVTDDGGLYDDAVITIKVIDVNEAPSCDDVTIELEENVPFDSAVGAALVVHDPDVADVGYAKFDLIDGIGIDEEFYIQGSQVRVNALIDYESKQSYELSISTTDKAGLQGFCSAFISILDVNEPPTFKDTHRSIDENSPKGTLIGSKLVANDGDANDTSDKLRYSFDDESISQLKGLFTIDSDGQLNLNQDDMLNYEQFQNYTCTVVVTDTGGLTDTATVIIDVNNINEKPVITIESRSQTVPENVERGFEIGRIYADDEDVEFDPEVQSLYFRVIDDPSGMFEIDNDNNVGILKVKRATLDYETSTLHQIKISVFDTGVPMMSETNVYVNIQVENVNEAPSCGSSTRTVPENTLANFQISPTLEVSDPDEGDVDHLKYSIVDSNYPSAFNIDENNGLITTSGELLNHESRDSVSLTIRVTDDEGLFGTCYWLIEIEDVNEKPELANKEVIIPENIKSGQEVIIPTVNDVDDKDYFTFAVLARDDNEAFVVDYSTGVVTLIKPSEISCSGGTCPSFSLTVQVTDSGGLKDDAVYSITVSDVNYPPYFVKNTQPFLGTFEFSFPENLAVGSPIGTVKCDDDNAKEGEITYSIDECDVQIDELTGELSVKNVINFERRSLIQTRIYCSEALLTSSLTSSAKLDMTIQDVNESPSISSYIAYIPENSFKGTKLMDKDGLEIEIVGTDPDIKDVGNLKVSFSMNDGSENLFDMSGTGGVITLKKDDTLNYEVRKKYSLKLHVEDLEGLSVDSDLIINIIDVNEAPVFEEFPVMTVEENSASGISVGVIQANDVDNNDILKYSILNGNINEAFRLNPITGEITVQFSDQLDYEMKSFYELNLAVTDQNGEGIRVTKELTIRLIDVNDVIIESVALEGLEPSEDVRFSTKGGDKVVLRGRNIGDHVPETSIGVKVTYGFKDGFQFEAADCSIIEPYFAIRCSTVSGYGDSLYWTVTILDRNHETNTLGYLESGYLPPSISSVLGFVDIDTKGGDLVTLEGSNFSEGGGVCSILLHYINDLNQSYSINGNCEVTVPHETIVCKTLPGIGKEFSLVLEVSNQEVTYLASGSKYASPQIELFNNLHLLDTSGDTLLLNGTYFGTDFYNVITANYGPIDDANRYSTTCALTVTDVQVQCASVPGVGTDHVWSISVGGLTSSNSLEKTSYKPPVISAVEGPGRHLALTEGGQRVTIAGEQLGPFGTIPDVTYGRVIESNNENGWEFQRTFIANLCSVTTPYKEITCETGEGVGYDLSWLIEVDGQNSNVLDASTDYAAPVIENYSGIGSSEALTTGQQEVVIYGKNFGTIAHNAINDVIYSRAEDLEKAKESGKEEDVPHFDALDCRLIKDHTQVRCLTNEGAGKELSWVITIAEQESSAPTTNYHIPVITGLKSKGSWDSDTDGDELVTIEGTNFGPASPSFLESVTYGSFSAKDCTVISHEEITCLTTPGFGDNLKWLVTVAEQVSEVTDVATSRYGLPYIDEILPDIAPTNGGNSIRIIGRNFALKHPEAEQYIVWTNGDDERILRPDLSKVDIDASTILRKHILSFILPAGSGKDIAIKVGVGADYQSSRFSEAKYFSYEVPNISGLNIRDSMSDPSKVIIEIQGNNFGQTGIVEIRPTEDSEEPNIIQYFRSYDHQIIELEYFGRQGFVTVITGNQTSDPPAEFKQQSPWLDGLVDESGNIYVSFFKFATDGGERLVVKGSRFDDVTQNFEISVGGNVCELVYDTHVPPATEGGVESIECIMPEGAGQKQQVIVKREMQTSQSSMFIDYEIPSIDDLFLCNDPTDIDACVYCNGSCRPDTVGSSILIKGNNFGASQLVAMISEFGSTVSLNITSIEEHHQLLLEIPKNEGSAKLQMSVAGQTLASENVPEFKYADPSLVGIAPDIGPTQGLDEVVISGKNFGSRGFDNDMIFKPNWVMVGEKRCEVLTFTHERIVCKLPYGVGKDLNIKISVADQMNTLIKGFSYNPPLVQSITPPIAPTQAIDDDHNPIVITVIGKSFGNSMKTGDITFAEWVDTSPESDKENPLAMPSIGVKTENILSWSHQEIKFNLPAGIGKDRVLMIKVGNSQYDEQDNSYQMGSSHIFSYSPPTILSLDPPMGETIGGTLIKIEGSSLGDSMARIALEGIFCEDCIPAQAHTLIQWEVPAGYGVNKTFELYVGNQAMVEERLFSYEPPQISHFVPSLPWAKGGDKLTVYGKNFGNVATETDILIDGFNCTEPFFDRYGGGNEATLECILPESYVGPKEVIISVAEQEVVSPAESNMLTYICYMGSFGQTKTVLDEEIQVPNNGSDNCMDCPVGSSCAGHGFGVEFEPISDEGNWVINITCEEHYPVNATTRAYCPKSVGCIPAESCCGSNTCCYGYQDERCVNCLRGEYYRRNGRCVKCPDNSWLLILGFGVAAIALCIGGYLLNKKDVHLAFLAIGVDYFQVLAMFARSDVEWPETIRTILDYMSVFQFNIDITAPECTMPDFGFAMKFCFIMFLPMGAIVVFCMLHIWQLFFKRCIKGQKKDLNSHLPALIGTSLTMFYFLYLLLTRVTLDVFNCNPSEPSDGYTYMAAAPSIKCGSSLHGNLLIGAIISVIVYSAGYPAIVAFVLLTKRELVKEDQLLRAMKSGDNKLTNPRCFKFRQTFYKMYYHFKPDCYYWTLLIVGRKFFIAFAALMFRNNPSFQLSIALLVMFIAYALQVRHNPYMSPKKFGKIVEQYELKAQSGDEYSKQLVLKAKNASHGPDGKHLNMKKRDMGVYIFDYNQVESLLLMCAVLITLSGIMFQSKYLDRDGYAAQKEFLTWIVLIIIFTSIIYYICVFVTEIWGTCRAKTRRRRHLTKREKIEGAVQIIRDFEMDMQHGGGSYSMNPMFHSQKQKLSELASQSPQNDHRKSIRMAAEQQIRDFVISNSELEAQNRALQKQFDELNAKAKRNGLTTVCSEELKKKVSFMRAGSKLLLGKTSEKKRFSVRVHRHRHRKQKKSIAV